MSCKKTKSGVKSNSLLDSYKSELKEIEKKKGKGRRIGSLRAAIKALEEGQDRHNYTDEQDRENYTKNELLVTRYLDKVKALPNRFQRVKKLNEKLNKNRLMNKIISEIKTWKEETLAEFLESIEMDKLQGVEK